VVSVLVLGGVAMDGHGAVVLARRSLDGQLRCEDFRRGFQFIST
jgi:hypothetical protein